MANKAGTIIDEFLIEVGLDPKKYESGRKRIVENNKKLQQDSTKTNKFLQHGAKQTAEGFNSMRGAAMRLSLALVGATGVTAFTKNMLKSDAATGRFAGNIGMLTGEVAAWEGAIGRVGGKSEEVTNALQTLSRIWWDYKLLGQSEAGAGLMGLNITPHDLENPGEAMLKIAEAAERLGRPELYTRLQRLGFSNDTINLLSKGRVELEAILEEQRALNPVTQQNAQAAAELEAQISKLKDTLEGKARPALSNFFELLNDTADGGDRLKKALSGADKVLVPLGIAAAIAGAPFIALAAAIGLVVLNFDTLKEKWGALSSTWDKITGRPSKGGSELILDIPSAADTAKAGITGDRPSMTGMTNRVLSTGPGGVDPEIHNALKQRYGAERAAGIVSGIKAEGGSLGMSKNGAFGIGQWRGSRLKELKKRYGETPTKQQQLEFLMWELEGGDWGGASVMSSKDSASALSNYIGGYGWGFMRPSTATDNSGRVGDMRRGTAALNAIKGGNAGTSVNIQNMTINSRATDADGIARDINASIGRRVTINQVNGGLS